MREILADAEGEQRAEGYGTVYSNVTCLANNNLRFTFGGVSSRQRGSLGAAGVAPGRSEGAFPSALRSAWAEASLWLHPILERML